ncbi:ABC-three component system protein [Novosphingobium sp. TCA1]|uniref:ABC-three component systems C-terminal domain-containing protein n=1 Tax=Novosphingobium pentaromativorans TaxID=205844 RepID=A0A2W5NHC1_9SPHN|nr:ABC-three component system protein [Novosphingobium sp. TCA1]PZQ51848.1 MAG: hypothetical protein DI555_20675 [Novosphingobium pentaromativorans]
MGAFLKSAAIEHEALSEPTPWPDANARLLGMGMGLPVEPLDRLAGFDPKKFERFTLEWAHGYLIKQIEGIVDIQQRGGAGDKGRDIIAWLDPATVSPRRWICYQCKHLQTALGRGAATTEIGKLVYYAQRGEYPLPVEYWFVTHKGVTGTLQDLLDDPAALKTFVKENWSKYVDREISSKSTPMTPELEAFIDGMDFGIFAAKQPATLLAEHAQTPYHLRVFGLPLIERDPPPKPPSQVDAAESVYIEQLYRVIGECLGLAVGSLDDFAGQDRFRALFERSRITFYSAEGLKELARDTMLDTQFFDSLLGEFRNGLYYDYTETGITGHERLVRTVRAAQKLQLGGHILADHVVAADREGMCHHMANENHLQWCGDANA